MICLASKAFQYVIYLQIFAIIGDILYFSPEKACKNKLQGTFTSIKNSC
jgi:hypothetical protein